MLFSGHGCVLYRMHCGVRAQTTPRAHVRWLRCEFTLFYLIIIGSVKETVLIDKQYQLND